jgi:hypothetical protein
MSRQPVTHQFPPSPPDWVAVTRRETFEGREWTAVERPLKRALVPAGAKVTALQPRELTSMVAF